MRKMITILLTILISVVPATAVALPKTVIPGGHTMGIKLYTGGLLVIGLVGVNTDAGVASPAESAGLMSGDIIIRMNENTVTEIGDLQKAVAESKGEPINVIYLREGTEMRTKLSPALSKEDEQYKIGAWIRDSIAGIGTITFYDPESGFFGALGHGINDSETGKLLPLGSGYVMYSQVESVRMGQPGQPGELKGEFRSDREYGKLTKNTRDGIFGILSGTEALGPEPREAVELCPAEEIQSGPAVILSNVSGDTVESYDIEIVKVLNEQDMSHSFLIHVTDPDLIAATGGIVQGMSGSPILQNGRLVGAVTHVLVNDPTRGYGLMIEEMIKNGYEALESETDTFAA